jgi:serine/threonine-protein kinase HSL1 (negative regulator of Swe1 kinase)
MHQESVVHRDIKLDNILLDGHGAIKIGDFGVSTRLAKPNEILFEQCGTPAYIAPEICFEMGYKGSPVDVWSAGICLYAMLYGNVPFKASNLSDLSREMYENELEFKEPASESVRDLLTKILTIDPKKRLTAFQALQH